jgi:Na+/H+-dicarboxylate symporter
MTLIITFSLLWTYPKTLNRQEPVNKEFIMLGLISLIPISVSTFIIATMYTYGFQSLITTELLTIMEFTLQMFWLFWIYIIFRRINGLDYVKSLLGSFIVNYIWLTVILFF